MKDIETFDCEKSIAQATAKFKQIKEYIAGEAQSESAYVVEKRLFKEVMHKSLYMMGAYFEKKVGGDIGSAITLSDATTLPRERLYDKDFVTVFGELTLKRWYYHEDGVPGFFPLDEEVNLPERSFSYHVQELLDRHTTTMTYEEAMSEMQKMFGFTPYKHTVENMVEDAARDVESFNDNQPGIPPETDLVKQRMAGSGMRWRIKGAESVLQLRALYLNGDWDAYWQHHMQCEYDRGFKRKAA